jgi:predicted RNase H-like HicB family nuclease
MITLYISEAMARATYRILEDGTWFGEIPGLSGVWSNEAALEECRSVLQEVLEEWLIHSNKGGAGQKGEVDRERGISKFEKVE